MPIYRRTRSRPAARFATPSVCPMCQPGIPTDANRQSCPWTRRSSTVPARWSTWPCRISRTTPQNWCLGSPWPCPCCSGRQRWLDRCGICRTLRWHREILEIGEVRRFRFTQSANGPLPTNLSQCIVQRLGWGSHLMTRKKNCVNFSGNLEFGLLTANAQSNYYLSAHTIVRRLLSIVHDPHRFAHYFSVIFTLQRYSS